MQINWPVSIWYEFLPKGISEQTIENNVLEFVVKCWKNAQEEVLFDQNESFYGIFYDLDHKLQDSFLNKS